MISRPQETQDSNPFVTSVTHQEVQAAMETGRRSWRGRLSRAIARIAFGPLVDYVAVDHAAHAARIARQDLAPSTPQPEPQSPQLISFEGPEDRSAAPAVVGMAPGRDPAARQLGVPSVVEGVQPLPPLPEQPASESPMQ